VAAALIALAVIVFIFVLFFIAAVKVAREYERGVVFRLGRLLDPPKGPGLFLLIPIIDRMVRVDLRTITLNIPPQEVITKDNVPARVNAVAYFRIVEPKAAIVNIENFMVATSQIAQTTLRSVLGQHVLDELLSERDKINTILQQIIDEATSPWGIKVSIVEVKDVEIPGGMQRAMARQAEAEREGREDRTPPEIFAVAPPGRKANSPGWQVRVVPNLYPAFEHQEVVVHTPRHVRSLAELTDEELPPVASAWHERLTAARTAGFEQVQLLVNEGREAGASLPHSHSQLVWLRAAPPASTWAGCRPRKRPNG